MVEKVYWEPGVLIVPVIVLILIFAIADYCSLSIELVPPRKSPRDACASRGLSFSAGYSLPTTRLAAHDPQ